jgi:hypothetical protein
MVLLRVLISLSLSRTPLLQAAPYPTVTVIVDTRPPILSVAPPAGHSAATLSLPVFTSGAPSPAVAMCVTVLDATPCRVLFTTAGAQWSQAGPELGTNLNLRLEANVSPDLDGSAVACATLPSAPDGNYTITVLALDAAGNPSVPLVSWWAVDSAPPVTTFRARYLARYLCIYISWWHLCIALVCMGYVCLTMWVFVGLATIGMCMPLESCLRYGPCGCSHPCPYPAFTMSLWARTHQIRLHACRRLNASWMATAPRTQAVPRLGPLM